MGGRTMPTEGMPADLLLEGGSVACVFLHGFVGTPQQFWALGEYLHARAITVYAPLLPGHGTRPEELNRVSWQDWVKTGQRAICELRARCKNVFVGGLSLGGLLATHLAIMYPDLSGLILYAPAFRVANPFLPIAGLARHVLGQVPMNWDRAIGLVDRAAAAEMWHYETCPVGGVHELYKLQRVVRRELGDVRVPVILFQSAQDTLLHPEAGTQMFEGLGSADKELVTLYNSGHVLTMDVEREAVFARTYGFITRHGMSCIR
ncbi:MAG: alpha/beta fold hydrolase [Chloroflexi bacterium]|nr:alpha/beta fold hydrolase [Chloroflexota bacterium]